MKSSMFERVLEILPWVPDTFLAQFPVSVKSLWWPARLRPKAEDVSAFGQHRKFPVHARKTSGTQGKVIFSHVIIFTCEDIMFSRESSPSISLVFIW